MPKHVILLCGPPPGAVGGGPTHMRNLLASPLATSFDLRVFETGSRGAESPARDEPLPAMLWRLISSPFALAMAILRHRPTVVHLNTSVTAKGFWREIPHLLVCALLGRRVAYQIHGGSLAALGARPGMRSLARMVYGWPDALVVLAEIEREEFERLRSVRRLCVIPNAVDIATFRTGTPRAHTGAVRRLGFLGRLSGFKGESDCVEAVALLRDRPEIELRFAGSGPARAELERLVASRGLGERVKFVGAIHGDERVRFLHESDLVLLPSHAEGLPYTVLESLAAGTPVIATRVGGIPDVMKSPEHGRFVEPGSPAAIAGAVRDLATSPETVRAMSLACLDWAVRELGLDRLAVRFEALYRELGAS